VMAPEGPMAMGAVGSETGLTPQSWGYLARRGTQTDQGGKGWLGVALQGEGGCSDNSELLRGREHLIRSLNNGISKMVQIT